MTELSTNLSLETKYWYLRNHKLFSVLDSAEMKTICLISKFKTGKKNEVIYFNHDDAQRVYSLKKGTIKIVEIDDAGHETVKDVLLAGDLFGQFSLEKSNLDEYAVVLSESVAICSFKLEDFEKVLETHPSLALKYTKLVGLRFRKMENRYANLMFKDVRTRLALFLKDWAIKEISDGSKQVTLNNYLTHQDIASLICSTRQTVTTI
jgi:CRP/FNR family transcriptional regulator